MAKYLIYILLFISSIGFSQVEEIHVISKMDETHILSDATTTNIWGFGILNADGTYKVTLPGPFLELVKGDSIEIHFHNGSPEDHTIHLHGLDVSQSEDGVPATSVAVGMSDSIVYSFVAYNTGTFLYHCHVLTTLHLNMGMYGMIIVHNSPEANLLYSGGPSFQSSYNFLASDMDRSVNDNPTTIPGGFHLFYQDYFMINGLSGTMLDDSPENHVYAHQGDSVLLRLGNIGYSKVRYIIPQELNARAYMSDGRPLPADFSCDTLVIFPGERYSVLLTPDMYTNTPIGVEYYELRNNTLQHTNYIQVNGDLGLNEEKPILEIYPNPTTSIFNFGTLEPGSTMNIYSMAGQLVKSILITDFLNDIDVSDLNAGIYIVRYNGVETKLVKQ